MESYKIKQYFFLKEQILKDLEIGLIYIVLTF